MKIMNLTENSKVYTSNVYLVLGTWNAINDVNTLIDVGSDESILGTIDRMNTGLGKKKIDQVILTHSHSDHMELLPRIIEKYNPHVYAFNLHIKGVTHILKDKDVVQIGDQDFEIFHITAHSSDSVCIYGAHEGILFSGDTNFPIAIENSDLGKNNNEAIARLSKKQINIIYPGHGPPRSYQNTPFRVTKNNN